MYVYVYVRASLCVSVFACFLVYFHVLESSEYDIASTRTYIRYSYHYHPFDPSTRFPSRPVPFPSVCALCSARQANVNAIDAFPHFISRFLSLSVSRARSALLASRVIRQRVRSYGTCS